MKRAAASRDIRNTIIKVSRDLFIEQGYKATTIRQIIDKAGITIGSLYHFYLDKEDIFIHVADDIIREFIQISDMLMGSDDDTILKYAFRFALELKIIDSSDIIAELFLEGYLSWRITQNLLPLYTQRAREIFQSYNKDFTDQDYHVRILAARGARMNFMIERMNQGKLAYDIKCPFLLEASLSSFNVPKDIIKTTIRKAMQLVNEKDIEIYGYRIAPGT
ncbi:MAG: TetR/AcrR family transcriptional regulator [Syntrophaceae bacterium]